MRIAPIDQHLIEMKENFKSWNTKPLLRLSYERFYKEITESLQTTMPGATLELGSGIGAFKVFYPSCITSDIFDTPWVDKVESSYRLSFEDESCANVVMFDVFHHLAYPRMALADCRRVLKTGGRLIIFDQYISLFGLFVYGLFHHEPLGLFQNIEWSEKSVADPDGQYYAATGNATRVFRTSSPYMPDILDGWIVVRQRKFSAISYILSGGFSKPSLYSKSFLPALLFIEKILDIFPSLFATRTIIVLEKK